MLFVGCNHETMKTKNYDESLLNWSKPVTLQTSSQRSPVHVISIRTSCGLKWIAG